MLHNRLLIVEGDIALSQMLKMRLEAGGYLVDCATSGRKALNILRSKWVDLIVLAIVLQGEMHGYQLFKEIKKKKRFSQIPIIMQSSKAGMKKTFMALGAEDFFVKPYSVDLVLVRIKKILT